MWVAAVFAGVLQLEGAAAADFDAMAMASAICDPSRFAAPLKVKPASALPAKASAGLFTPRDAKRLFGAGDRDKPASVKETIAAGNPVLVTLEPGHQIELSEDLWVPLEGEAAGPQSSTCGDFLIVIGYDNKRYGGAFELMGGCADARYGQAFFWMRYDDFAALVECGVELLAEASLRTDAGVGSMAETTLSGRVRLQDSSGNTMPVRWNGDIYRMARSYPGGTRFRVVVESDSNANVYVISADSHNQVAPLFPVDGASPFIAGRESAVQIPSRDSFLQLDESTGSDFLCVLQSAKAIDFDTLVAKVIANDGEPLMRIRKALGNDAVPPESIQRGGSGEVSFVATPGRGFLVPVLIEIPHSE